MQASVLETMHSIHSTGSYIIISIIMTYIGYINTIPKDFFQKQRRKQELEKHTQDTITSLLRQNDDNKLNKRQILLYYRTCNVLRRPYDPFYLVQLAR